MGDINMTHQSLFSGIGGLDLAAEWAGFRTVGQCEWADYPTRVLEKHWPDVPRWRDIRTLTKESFYAKTGLRTAHVISGGFPCQPFSVAGKRRGRDDDRYLWPEMCRVIAELRPTWVVGENVAGIISMGESVGNAHVESRTINRLPDYDYYEAVLSQQERMLLIGILEDLEQIGYAVQPLVIPACAVGAPHRRDRIAIVAYCEGGGERGLSVQSRTSRQAGAHFDRRCQTMANADGGAMRHDGHDQWATDREIDTSRHTSDACGADVSDTHRHGLQKQGMQRLSQKSAVPAADGSWWATEPDVGRVAHGIPHRVDRLRGLGNAVVPQQFYPIFRAIMEVERE